MGVDLVEQGRQQVNSAFLQNMAFTCFKDNGEVLVGSVEGRCGLAWLLFTLWGSVWEAFERNATPDTVGASATQLALLLLWRACDCVGLHCIRWLWAAMPTPCVFVERLVKHSLR